jgi:flavodoxin
MKGKVKRALVVYDTMHGNTGIVAEKIAEGIRVGGGIRTDLGFMEDTDVEKIPKYDIAVIGTPNHYSKPSEKAKNFIEKIEGKDLEGKKVAAFDTCLRKQQGRAFGRIEKRIREIAPGALIITPGLSILVGGVKGPILEGELPKCEEFGMRIAQG